MHLHMQELSLSHPMILETDQRLMKNVRRQKRDEEKKGEKLEFEIEIEIEKWN